MLNENKIYKFFLRNIICIYMKNCKILIYFIKNFLYNNGTLKIFTKKVSNDYVIENIQNCNYGTFYCFQRKKPQSYCMKYR